MTKELVLPAAPEQLDKVLSTISDELNSNGCPSKTCQFVILAAEEIFVNIVSYAYSSSVGVASILYEVDPKKQLVTISFIDEGVAYNPLEKADPDITLDAEARPIGGLGIFMVKKMMDNVTYKREDGKNVLTLIKKF